jgi:cell wall-associated NlpC family hydrolase
VRVTPPLPASLASLASFAVVAVVAIGAVLLGARAEAGAPPAAVAAADVAGADVAVEAEQEPPAPELDPTLRLTRTADPARTIVEDADGAWVATFTDGAATVALAGPERTLDEPTATHAVTTDAWVRLLPAPFDGEIDVAWFEAALLDDGPDVFEIATEYLSGAPEVYDDEGVLIAGDADYGPLQPDGSRPVGSDWHDFRGVDAVYDGKVDPADPEEYQALDCSGYTRTIFGARLGMSLSLRPDGGTSLPRRSFEQAAEAPGVVPIDDGAVDPDRLQAGDLVFFDSPADDDDRIDHVGVYLGVDDGGHHRFVHSRRSANGPTLGGDEHGPSILDGDGYFARGFVSTRRL